jgi:PAS domain S-box-containing protein
MEEVLPTAHVKEILAARRDAIAEQWQRAIGQSSYIPLSAAEIRVRLSHLVDEAIDALFAQPWDAKQAQGIGEALARMHFIHPEVAAGTVGVLGRELSVGLAPEQLTAVHPRLTCLLQEVVSGYFRCCLDVILQEQEGIRNALVTGLRIAEQQLREARDELEVRVEQRTEELAQANKDLRTEIAERLRAEVALRESEEKYRELVENISDIIYAIDQDGIISYISPAIERILGYDPQDVVGTHFSRFIHPDDMPRLEKMLHRVLAGSPLKGEYRIIGRSGEIRWMRTSSRPIVIDDRAAGVRGVLADITERKQMEQNLQASEERYRAVVQEQTDLICRFRPDGTYTFVNEAYARFYGRQETEALGMDFTKLMSREEAEIYRARIQALTPEAPVRYIEQQSTRSSREDCWLQWSLRGMFDEDGQLREVQAVGRDITERKEAEEALRQSEERWRSLVENAPEVVVTLDRQGGILFVNRAPEGSPKPEDLVGSSAMDYVVPDQRESALEALNAVFEQGRQAALELAVMTPDGDVAWQAIRLGPIWHNGEVTAAMLVVRDISEQKKLEEMKDDLIRDVSHELRTPLAKVQMSLELLQEIVSDESMDRARAIRTSEVAARNVRRLLETVEGILDLSRLEAGTLGYTREQVSLEELAAEVIAYMQPLAKAKDLRLELQPTGHIHPLEGDREKLFRVLVNLVDNAIKFTDEGQVIVSVEGHDGEAMVSVSDSGEGISAENLGRIFERFFQARTTARGVGIGLTICQAIVEGHGGRIWAESPGKGRGTTVWVSLPFGNGP